MKQRRCQEFGKRQAVNCAVEAGPRPGRTAMIPKDDSGKTRWLDLKELWIPRWLHHFRVWNVLMSTELNDVSKTTQLSQRYGLVGHTREDQNPDIARDWSIAQGPDRNPDVARDWSIAKR
eukprot:3690117-Amphidinium_carterae.1